MNKKQAQTLIKETFESSFDKGRFNGFIKNLFNQFDETKAFSRPMRGQFIREAFRDSITEFDRLGRFTDIDGKKIDILIVCLQREKSIENARTQQRNFIAGYLKGDYGSSVDKDAALVAFYHNDSPDWRFSLVTINYEFKTNQKGVIKPKEEFTPARRWSFLVGVNENSHTVQSQLVDIVADDERNPTLGQLEEAFNIEKVTKEFFEKYRDLFLWTKETLDDVVKKDKKIKEDFEVRGVNTVDFSKKLLGQIVFLYFLQKKGWFGVKRDADWGTGPKNFLRELFEGKHGTYKNFFNDILEPLFYEALRNDRSHEDHYFSMFKCKIPFLNGGLFDPINNYEWKATDIFLPNDLFSNDYKTKEGDKGNGILDIFDR
ncbi:MAG: class I SAM-dependent DNA methyltransferase, partial [Syntrophorhabdus sp.]